MSAGHIAVTVARKEPSKHGATIVFAAWKDRRHTGADRAPAFYERAIAGDQGLHANFDADDIGDRVVWPRSAIKRDT